MNTEKPLTIAIESAILGGSLSLYQDGNELDSRFGDSAFTRAEELMPDIDLMLKENGHHVSEVGLVVVSAGPGSFTGIRIGFSTALGLSTGLGAEMASESALRAMANQYRGHSNLVVAIPMGRGTVCSQIFDTCDEIIEKSGPMTQPDEIFLSLVSSDPQSNYLLHQELFSKIGEARPNVFDFGQNIASAIAKVCMDRPRPQTDPIFISKNTQ